MKKLLLFWAVGALSRATAQTGDTQGVSMQLTAKSSLYDRVAVLNYLQNQEYDDAVAYLAPILKADSGNAALLGYAGYAYYETEDYRAAGACYRRLLAMDSVNIPALHYLLLISMNDYPAESLEYARRLVQLQKGRAPWWRMQGEIYARMNARDSALVYFDKAYALAPTDLRTIAGLADVLMTSKNFDRVDTIVDQALERDSLNPTLNKLAVRSAYLSQRYVRAIVPGERLVRSDDPSGQALTSLALSYYNLKAYPDCIRVCEHMMDLGLTDQAVYYYESRAWTKLGQYRTSDSLLRIALKMSIEPTTEWYYFDLAANHDALRECREAVANYDTAYYLFRDPTVLYTCGRICETEIHDLARARKYYLRYLAVAQPKTKEEREAVEYVRRRWGKGARPPK
jgi:tetratricopeptide (TPR) repeat protein